MAFSYDDYLQIIGLYFYPFVRIGAMLMIVPLFGGQGVPERIRLLLAVVVTLAVAPMLELPPPISPFTWHGVLLITQQVGIGIATGLVFLMIFQAFVLAGHMASMTMGLAFAQMADPISGVNSPVVARYYTLIATLLFLLFNGHVLVIYAVVDNFENMPIGLHFFDQASLQRIMDFSSAIFSAGVMISLPVVTSLLLVNVSFGVIARAAPALNIFAVGFSITILGGLVMLHLTTPLILPNLQTLFQSAIDTVGSLRLTD